MRFTALFSVLFVSQFLLVLPEAHAVSRGGRPACVAALADNGISEGVAELLQGDGSGTGKIYALLKLSALAQRYGDDDGAQADTQRLVEEYTSVVGWFHRLQVQSPEYLWHLNRGVIFVELTGTVRDLKNLLSGASSDTILWAGLNHSSTVAEKYGRATLARARAAKQKVKRELEGLGVDQAAVGISAEVFNGVRNYVVRVSIPLGTFIDPSWPEVMDGVQVVYIEVAPLRPRRNVGQHHN